MNFSRNLFIENAKIEGHSESFIQNTLNYADNLIGKNLPVIFSIRHFALLVGLDYKEVNSIIKNRENQYSYYLIKKKKKGEYRRIIAPHKYIKYIQRWINSNILQKIALSQYATGFVKNKSILDNAKFHEKSSVVLNIDLSNFFETVNEKRVFGIFKSLGYASNLAFDFAKICTATISDYQFEKLSEEEQVYFKDLKDFRLPILIQGAPTSPAISNLICRRLDFRFSRLANKHGANYSRYADDMTFSGEFDNLPKISVIKEIIEDEGFVINWNKVKIHKKGQRQMVTGLLIDNKIRVPQKFKKEIYRHLFFCKKYGAKSHFDRIAPDKGFRKEWLLGKIMYVKSIEPTEFQKMIKLVNEINWEI